MTLSISSDAEIQKLRADLAEAERRAGCAERELAAARADVERLDRVRQKMKAEWGVDDKVSFDVVWAQALELKRASTSDAEDAANYRWLRSGAITRQGEALANGGGRSLAKGPLHSLMRFQFWCSTQELDERIRAARLASPSDGR